MTTDNFTEAARAEAERRYNRIVRRNKTADEWLDEGRASGFTSGAEWARTHLAAQEPTDAEVEAAAGAMYRNPEGWASVLSIYKRLVAEGNPRAKGHTVEHRLDLARDALSAARAAELQISPDDIANADIEEPTP